MFGQQNSNNDKNEIKDQDKEKIENKAQENKDIKIQELENKIKELDNNWKRALADYQNLVKRSQEEIVSVVSYGNRHLLIKILEILDHLEEAQKHLSDKGIELVIKLFEDALKSEGVLEMKRLNQKFDPNFDECVDKRPASADPPAGEAGAMAGEAGEKNNIIVEVVRRGYLFKDKVMRPAKVVVEVSK